MSGLDEATRTLLGKLAGALCWRDRERPRAYGARLAELRGMLHYAAATGETDPLEVWLDGDAGVAASAAVVTNGRTRRPRSRSRSALAERQHLRGSR
jgi:hypothetical protein